MSIQFPLPIPPSGYQRIFAAEIDCLSANELLVRGQFHDHRIALEQTWNVRTPEYEVIAASARQVEGDPQSFAPELCERYSKIAGVRVGRGFTKRVQEALGNLPGLQEHLFFAIEMARVAQQVYQFPPGFEEQFVPTSDNPTEQARVAWTKDRTYMPELANSCFTYRDESANVFAEREVRCGFEGNLTRPQPGDKRVFWRKKQLVISSLPNGGYQCESAMQDRIHDIQISFAIAPDGVISQAQSRGERLPYYGICEGAQLRTPGLNGQRVTASYVKQFAEQVGGASGCTHLFDLSMDCLRLFQIGAD
ncbi:MAG: DUF2889 domain-containing protein [Acidobacteria bacterium]|nr:DUF2889 domain-containing protein [Acidobacteriota bacterium]